MRVFQTSPSSNRTYILAIITYFQRRVLWQSPLAHNAKFVPKALNEAIKLRAVAAHTSFVCILNHALHTIFQFIILAVTDVGLGYDFNLLRHIMIFLVAHLAVGLID